MGNLTNKRTIIQSFDLLVIAANFLSMDIFPAEKGTQKTSHKYTKIEMLLLGMPLVVSVLSHGRLEVKEMSIEII